MKRLIIALPLLLLTLTAIAQVQYRVSGTVVTEQEFVPADSLTGHILVGSPRGDLVVRADSTNMTIELRSTGEIVANEFVEKGTFSSPVAWYPLGESSRITTQTADFSYNANHADTTLITYATDRFGNANEAMSFDGADSKVDTGADIIDVGPGTVSVWIYANSFGEGDSGRITYNSKHSMRAINTGGRTALIECSTDGTSGAMSPDNSMVLSEWLHVVFSWNINGISNIYINGVLSGAANQDPGSPLAGDVNLFIGNQQNSDRAFDGLIDDVLIFNHEFGATEVLTYYNQTKP